MIKSRGRCRYLPVLICLGLCTLASVWQLHLIFHLSDENEANADCIPGFGVELSLGEFYEGGLGRVFVPRFRRLGLVSPV